MQSYSLVVSVSCLLSAALELHQESLSHEEQASYNRVPIHISGVYFGPLEVSRSGFLYRRVGAGSRCVDSSGARYGRLRSTYARGLGECMDSCNAFALGACRGVSFQESANCTLVLEAGADIAEAPGLDRQSWTLMNGTGAGPVVASEMGLDGRGGACYRRQLDQSCHPPGHVKKIVWEGCRCLTYWALELDDGVFESPAQAAPSHSWQNCAREAHLDGDEYIIGMTQYGGGYCNYFGGWGRSFDFLTNKRMVTARAPGKPQLHVASEIPRRAVTVSRTKEGGKFFLFEKTEWMNIFGMSAAQPGAPPVKTRLKQVRRNELIWQGQVVIWSNANGPHGRRSHEGESGQWQSGDLLVPATGPDAGAVDFLLARLPSTATRKSEFVFRITKMETPALYIKEISLFHATGTDAAALGGDVVRFSQKNVYGLNEDFAYNAEGYIDYEDVDVTGPGCASGGKLRYGGLHDGDETKSDCSYQKVDTSIGADILSIQTASSVRYVRVCTAQDAWAEFDILKDETSVLNSTVALLGASQPGKLRCWLYTLDVAPEPPVSFMSKAGKGSCDDGKLLLGHSGFSSEEKVQEKCRELRCGYYIWSDDPASSRHSAWFCTTNYYGQVNNAQEHPHWKVGFVVGNYVYGQAGSEECPAASSPLSLSECKVFALTDRAKNGQGKRCSTSSEGASSSFANACTGKARQTAFCNLMPKGCWAEDRGQDGLCVFYNDGTGTGATVAVSICQKEDLAVRFRVDNLANSPGQLRFKRGGAWANKAISSMVLHNASKYRGFSFTVGVMDDASPPGFAMGLSSRPDEEKEEWFKTWDFSVVQARQDQRLYILESNQLAGNPGQFGLLRSGDTVGLAVSTTGKMEYWVNGELKHVSEKQPRYPLYVVGNFMASGARIKDIKWWEGKKDVVLNLEEKAQFSLRVQAGKQLLGPFVGPVAGLYPEGRVTQVGLADVCSPDAPAPSQGNGTDAMPGPEAVTSTCGGTGGGAACKFPFEFNGKTYNHCTKEGNDRPWCFTVAGEATWGNCDCPAQLLATDSVLLGLPTKTTCKGERSFEYALVAAATRSGDAGYSSCWDIGEIQFFSDQMCQDQISVNSRSISVSTYEDDLEHHEYEEISKDMLCRAGVDGPWYVGGRRAANGGPYDSLDACKELCSTERTCAFFGYRAKDGRCEFFTAFGDCEKKMGGAPGFAMYKKLKPLQTAQGNEVSCAKMALLPVKKGPMEARCRSGNDLDDGFEYIFNTGAGTAAAACGEASVCECCMRQKMAEAGPWPVASKGNTRCGVVDLNAKVGIANLWECQRKAVDAGHAFFSLFDAGSRKECLTSATCTTVVEEAHGWRVYGRRPAGQKEMFGLGSAALPVAQGASLWTEIADKQLATSKLVDGLDVTPLRAWGRQAVWVRAEVPGKVGCVKVFQSAAELNGCRPSSLVEVKRRADQGAAWTRLATGVWPTSPSWVRIALNGSQCVGTNSTEPSCSEPGTKIPSQVAFYSVGFGTCQDDRGQQPFVVSRHGLAPRDCEEHCKEMLECLGYLVQSETCRLYLSSALDLPDGWSLEAGAESAVVDIAKGSGGPEDVECMKKGLHYCGWTPKPSIGASLDCGLDSPNRDGCSHSSCADVLACQAVCDRCAGCVGFTYQALSDSGIRCYMKSSWTDPGRDFVAVTPDADSWQSYVNARYGSCAATQRTVHYCGWTKQIARNSAPLDCGLQSPGGEGCSTEACPDLASCKARCSACHGCVGFDIMEQGNSGHRCWMRSSWEHDTDYQLSNPDNSSWHPYVNERDALCNQDPKLQQMRGQVLKHVGSMPGHKEEGDDRASTCLRCEVELEMLPRGPYTLYAEVKLRDAAGGKVINWGANGDEDRVTSPCLKARYWGLAATEASANGYYEPFYLDFFESADGTGEPLPTDEVYIQGFINPGVKITQPQSNRGRHFLQYKPNQQNWGVSWTEHQVPLIYRDLGSEKVIRSALHRARPNHVPQEALIVASNDGLVWYARFRSTGATSRELINQPVQCQDPFFVPEPEDGSDEEVVPMRKHALWVGGDSVKSIWGRNVFEVKLNKSLVDGKWHSIMSTFDGVMRKLWVDHTLLATKGAKNLLSIIQTSNFCVGSRDDGQEAFPGDLRNLQIFTEAKMPGSIQADMNVGLLGAASMSSVLNVGSEGAINDNSLDSRAVSVEETNPWVQVDLGSAMPIGRIQLENVDADKCASRLFLGTECSWDYDVGNYSAADQGANLGISLTPCEGHLCGGVICTRITGSNRNGTGHTYAGDCQGRHGRYVYVQLPGPTRVLDLRELRVFKAASAATTSETVLCADGSTSCAGDVCCPGFEASGFRSYPCPSARDTFQACQIKTKLANALANVSREVPDEPEENFTLNATVAAAADGKRVFVPMDGGIGRSCRGAHPGDWRGSYVVKHPGRSLEMCKLICRSHPLCQGIEYNDDCEVWVRAEGIGASVAYDGRARFSTCMRLVPQDVAPKTRFASQQGRKCRGKPYTMDQAAGCNGWKGLTIEGCKEKCRMNSIAEKCPAKLCAAAVFFMSSRFCHLYDDCEETDADRSALLLQREVTALQAWPGLVAKGEEVNPNPGMFDFGAGPQSFSILAGVSNVKQKEIQGEVQGPILSKLSVGRGKAYWSDARGWEFGIIYDKKCRCRLLRFICRTASGHTFFGYGSTPLEGAEVEVAMSFDAKAFAVTMWVNGKEEKVVQRPLWYRSRFAGEFSSRARLTIGRRSGGSGLFTGQLFNAILYRGVLQGKDFAGWEVTALKHQFVGVGKSLSDDWIQVRSSLLEGWSKEQSEVAAQTGNWSEAVPCKGCSRYTQHRVGGACQYDKSKTLCAVCMPPDKGVFNCQCGRRFPHTCVPCGKEDLCSSLANEPPLELGRATLHGVSFHLHCQSSGNVQLQAQVIAPYSGSDVFYLSMGSCPSWRWFLHSGWGTNCAEDENCAYQDDPRWTMESEPCKLQEGKHFVTFRPSHPGDLKLTRLRLSSGSDFCSFEPLPPAATTTTTTYTTPPYLQGACPSEAEEARDFNDCPFRYYVLEVLTTAGEEAAWKIGELRLYHVNARGRLQKFPSSNVRAELIEDDAETRGCEASNASNAFDLSVLSGLCSPSPMVKLRLDLGKPVAITKYTVISANASFGSFDPASWRLWGSADGKTASDMSSLSTAVKLSEVSKAHFPSARWMCDPPWGVPRKRGYQCPATTTSTTTEVEVMTTTTSTTAMVKKDRCFYRYYALQVLQANDDKATAWQLAEIELRQNGKALLLPKSRGAAWFVHGRAARPATILDDGTEAYNVLDGNLATVAQPDGGFSANYTSLQVALGQRVRIPRSSSTFDYAAPHFCMDDDEDTRCSTAWNGGAGELNPWWQVDLGIREAVEIVALLSHPDGCEARYGVDVGDLCTPTGAVVSISDVSCAGHACPGEPCGKLELKGKDNWYYVSCEGKVGRYVQVQLKGQRVLNFREFRLLDKDAVTDVDLPQPAQKMAMDHFMRANRNGYYDTRCHQNLASTIRGSSPEKLEECARACLNHGDCGGFSDYSGMACVIMTKSKLSLEQRCAWTDDDKASYYERQDEVIVTTTTTTTRGVDTSVVEDGWEGNVESSRLAAKLVLDLGEQNYLTEYAVVSGSGPESARPKKWILKGSNDASVPMDEWDELSKVDSEKPPFPAGQRGQRKPLLFPVSCSLGFEV